MNKSDIINQTAQITGQSKSATAETINIAISIIQDAVSSGTVVSIQSFVSFTPINKKGREYEINGIKIFKPEHQGIRLKAMKPFKDKVEK